MAVSCFPGLIPLNTGELGPLPPAKTAMGKENEDDLMIFLGGGWQGELARYGLWK